MHCLIVSQYRHSYHTFIVKVPEDITDFKSMLLGVTAELEKYKRDKSNTKEIHYGDLEYLLDNTKEIFHSYNINDDGDIYIRIYKSIDRLKDIACYYRLEAHKYSRGYKRKEVISDINEHHNYNRIREIIEKYFEIA